MSTCIVPKPTALRSLLFISSILEQYDNRRYISDYTVNYDSTDGTASIVRPSEVGSFVAPNDLYLRLFTEKDKKEGEDRQSSSASLNRTPGTAPKTPRASIATISSATKALREKVADTNLLSAFASKKVIAKQRASKGQEKLLAMQRELGLDASVNGSDVQSGSDQESVMTGEGSQIHADLQFQLDGLPLSEQCEVCIECVKLKNLQSSSFFGKANAYAAFSLGGMRIKTKVVWGSNNPVWDKANLGTEFKFYLPKERLHQLRLNVHVYDKERIRRKRSLGYVILPLSTLNLRPIEAWFALEGEGSGTSTELYVVISTRDRAL